jgi:hypothetical protein
MTKILIITTALFLIFSCAEHKQEEKKAENQTNEPDYLALGNQITNTAQKTLLHHVGSAMKMGGPIAAIQYCNINAMTITDSLSETQNATISRVTDRTRNKNNSLAEEDMGIWGHYKTGEINVQMGDTLIDISDKKVYYKPIYIANPACLNCHGQSGTDVIDVTVAKLDEFYPEDKAREYNLGELRGMWKVVFN